MLDGIFKPVKWFAWITSAASVFISLSCGGQSATHGGRSGSGGNSSGGAIAGGMAGATSGGVGGLASGGSGALPGVGGSSSVCPLTHEQQALIAAFAARSRSDALWVLSHTQGIGAGSTRG